MARGRLIVLDGPDGAGKTTQVLLLARALTEYDIANEVVFEPGYTPLGRKIRVLVLDPEVDISPLAQVFLFNADRAQLHEHIRTQLASGTWIVSDRSWLSTIAYQCFGGGQDIETIMQMCQLALAGVRADLLIMLNVSDEVALQRRGERAVTDRFEQEQTAFHARVKHGFLTMASELGLPIVDGDPDAETVRQAIWNHVVPLLERSGND